MEHIQQAIRSTLLRAAPAAAIALVFLLGPLGIGAQLAHAQTYSESVLYSFAGGTTDGANPYAGLIRDKAGALYGTTYAGGTSSFGTVYKLSKTGKETVLHSFAGGMTDGEYSFASLFEDAAHNLYGVTNGGGASGFGTVFKLRKTGTETVLHSFAGGTDGSSPMYGGLVRDKAGNLYGVTSAGGSSSSGTVFKVTKTGTETVLYSFTGGTDGSSPQGGLVRGKAGNLYGTTGSGGTAGAGTVFKIDTAGTETVLHSFTGGTDGSFPVGGLIRDKAGNLYGTTVTGGAASFGTVFKVTKSGTETVLYSFTGTGGDGSYPVGGVVLDPTGNVYGTTNGGGSFSAGTVFKIDTTGTETVLYTFTGGATDGAYPYAGLVRDKKGNFYGTTEGGGASSVGTVFKITP